MDLLPFASVHLQRWERILKIRITEINKVIESRESSATSKWAVIKNGYIEISLEKKEIQK